MACKAVVHDEAKHALLQAADYLMLVSDGPSAAQRLIKAFNERVAEIAENPDLYGLSRAEGLAEAGYHAALVTSYIILYYISEDVVHIAWFFHQSQDYARYVLPQPYQGCITPTDDEVDGLFAAASSGSKREGGALSEYGAGIVWEEFHMSTNYRR